MGATITHHPRPTSIEMRLSSQLHESQRIRRVAWQMEFLESQRDLRLAAAFSRRRLEDLRHPEN